MKKDRIRAQAGKRLQVGAVQPRIGRDAHRPSDLVGAEASIYSPKGTPMRLSSSYWMVPLRTAE